MRLTTIGFDADDTLWQNERYFRLTEERFAALLADHADTQHLSERLLQTAMRNLEFYGFGIKSFVLSMMETAVEVTEGRVPGEVLGRIMEIGRDLMRHPIEPLPHVADTLEALAGRYRLVLVTKGDLFDQERKLAQSGLGGFFDGVEIVSTKTVETYARIFRRHGDGPERSMMVGNSLKSDVIPAIRAGSWGVFVPHELTWTFEHDDPPEGELRYRELPHLGELQSLIEEIENA
ncbi:HAD family hydrolase [Chelativorans sp. SCAU2101]|jgi:Predicted hydrolase (HAD superfamily)|uniref:HAD family hydrolase n=1 Tax=Chelativorans petroleitrophicus TaxID=2975484 RepID=A0A9X2X7J3_9HYPH|nr:HAD family hydrolase [Chelativorans petroleitrophicus]MCT8989207.1 HAD family hydrolase [Chelativorans petroleitrophicus]